MEYSKEITLKDGTTCLLRSGTAADGRAAMDIFLLTHGQTDFLLTYPEESTLTPDGEGEFLEAQRKNPRAVEILAILAGRVVGSAGIEPVGEKMKLRHRAEFGISIKRSLGAGNRPGADGGLY